ncbi:MAG: hypothetical protein LUG93_05125 [Lachnospiraceae bacterium]|nr:hypothetical protein [Lachnospiraceae bacterium]
MKKRFCAILCTAALTLGMSMSAMANISTSPITVGLTEASLENATIRMSTDVETAVATTADAILAAAASGAFAETVTTTEVTDENGNVTTVVTVELKNTEGGTDAVVDPIFTVATSDTSLYTTMAEGSEYTEAVASVMADIVKGVNEGEEGYRDTYYLVTEIFAQVQAALDALNESIENEDEQYSLTIVILDEDGNPVEVHSDADIFEGRELLTLFSDAVFVAKDDLEEHESGDGVTYSYTKTYMAQNTKAEEHVETASSTEESAESTSAHLYQATFPAPDVISGVTDEEWETLDLLQYDPSTATFYNIPLTEDMYDAETGDLTVDFPCTGSFTLTQDMVKLAEIEAEAETEAE